MSCGSGLPPVMLGRSIICRSVRMQSRPRVTCSIAVTRTKKEPDLKKTKSPRHGGNTRTEKNKSKPKPDVATCKSQKAGVMNDPLPRVAHELEKPSSYLDLESILKSKYRDNITIVDSRTAWLALDLNGSVSSH